VAVIVPPYAYAIWFQLAQRTITLNELFLYPLAVGGGSVVFTLLVYRIVSGEQIASLNLKPGKWYTDIFIGFLLAAVFLGLFMLQQIIQSNYFPMTVGPPPDELVYRPMRLRY